MLNCLAVDEGRKRVLLIAASILAARNLAQWDGRPSPASEAAMANAIAIARAHFKQNRCPLARQQIAGCPPRRFLGQKGDSRLQ
jgi:hypothetical protein